MPKATKERLYRLTADLASTAAMMAWDCGLQRQAQDYYRLALRSAYAGGDFAFGANVLAGMARQMISLGRPHDALELIRLAQQRANSMVSPRLMSKLHTREAWAFAAMGRVAAFQRSTRQAQENFAQGINSEEPSWIRNFNEAELAGVTGGRLLELARNSPKPYAEQASAEIQRALGTRGPEAGRSFALDRIGLAECRFLLGDTVGGVEQGHLALNAVDHTRSDRAQVLLGDLYRQIGPYANRRPVFDLQNRMRELLTSRKGPTA